LRVERVEDSPKDLIVEDRGLDLRLEFVIDGVKEVTQGGQLAGRKGVKAVLQQKQDLAQAIPLTATSHHSGEAWHEV
jgi:hypothetical protein